MNKLIILRALFTHRQTAAQVEGIVDDMNSTKDSWELSCVLRERKYPFKLPALHAFPLINKTHAGRERKSSGSSSSSRASAKRVRREERVAIFRQTIEYARYTNRAKASDTSREDAHKCASGAGFAYARMCILPIPGTYKCT